MVKELVQDKLVERLNETKAKGSVLNNSSKKQKQNSYKMEYTHLLVYYSVYKARLSKTIYCHFVDDLVKELIQSRVEERSNDSNSDVLEKYINESKAKGEF